MRNYNLIEFDRTNLMHREFTKNLVMSCYTDRYTAKEFPHARAETGIFNPENYDEDLSRIIMVNGKMAGILVLVHARDASVWELGLFHIRPELQRQGIGSSVLAEAETWVRKTAWSVISMYFHSPRSLVNGVPAFRGDVLSFFTKRGFYIKEQVAGAYINTPNQFCFDKEKLCGIIERNQKDGYLARDVTADDHDYGEVRKKTAQLCTREKRTGWQRFFSEDFPASERIGISVIEKDDNVVAVAGYNFAPVSPTVWGYTPQWGPLLADTHHRKRGLATWVIHNSLNRQFEKGVSEVILWTGVNSIPSKLYESFGFRLLCPWFCLEKQL